MEFLIPHKRSVDAHLERFLRIKQEELATINRWGQESIHGLVPFVASGKTIRGSLLLYTHSLFQKTYSTYVLDAASAMELFQSGLLIDDDIMDEDAIRRGRPSIHMQYRQMGKDLGGMNIDRFGESMAVNVADLCFFLGYELLSGLPEKFTQVARIVSQEFSRVVVAQMQDVSVSHLSTKLNQADILSLYSYKTARYSFSLPLRIGAILGGADASHASALENFGEGIGILFQIRDDELSMSGDSEITGKPTGNDARNRKQTLASVAAAGELLRIKNELTEKNLSILQALPIAETNRTELKELLSFCSMREK